MQEIDEYSKKRVRKINSLFTMLPMVIVLCCILYFRFDLDALTLPMFLVLLASVILSIAGPYLLLLFISYDITKEARGLTATKKDWMIKTLTPVLINVISLSTFFAVLYLPLLFQGFRELCSHPIFLAFYLPLSLVISLILGGCVTPVIHNWITKVEPINDPQIREKMNRLLKKSNLKCREILLVKDAKWKNANAMVMGIFQRFRFLYLTDYLIDNFSVDEIETVIGHELGHIKHKHPEKFVLFSIIGVGALIGIYLFFIHYLNISFDQWELIVMDAIIVMIYLSLLFPLISRRFELQADSYAVELTEKPETYISALKKVAQINEMPSVLSKGEEIIQRHPSIEHRIEKINNLKDALQHKIN